MRKISFILLKGVTYLDYTNGVCSKLNNDQTYKYEGSITYLLHGAESFLRS